MICSNDDAMKFCSLIHINTFKHARKEGHPSAKIQLEYFVHSYSVYRVVECRIVECLGLLKSLNSTEAEGNSCKSTLNKWPLAELYLTFDQICPHFGFSYFCQVAKMYLTLFHA